MEKEKKPIFKKWWFWVIIAVVVLIVIGAAAGGSGSQAGTPTDPPADRTDPPSAQTSEPPAQTDGPAPTEGPTEGLEHTEEPTEAPTAAPTEKPTTGLSSSGSLETAALLVKASLKENFDYYEVKTTEDALIVNVWGDGIAAGVLALQTTGDTDNESWLEMKESFVEMAGSIRNLMDTCGCEDAYLQLNLLNDMNTDNILLTLYNTTVVYDVLAE